MIPFAITFVVTLFIIVLIVAVVNIYRDSYMEVPYIGSSSITGSMSRGAVLDLVKSANKNGIRASTGKKIKLTQDDFCYIYSTTPFLSTGSSILISDIDTDEELDGNLILIKTEDYNKHICRLNPINKTLPIGSYVVRKYIAPMDIYHYVDDNIDEIVDKLDSMFRADTSYVNRFPDKNTIKEIINNARKSYKYESRFSLILNERNRQNMELECIPASLITKAVRYIK